MEDFLEIGKIVNTHALKGEVKILPWADSAEFLQRFSKFYLKKEESKELLIERSRVSKNVIVVKFKDIDTIEQAEKLKGEVVYIKREDAQLEEDQFFIKDIIGLTVIDRSTEFEYGKIVDVVKNPANDIYEICSNSTKYFLPIIKGVIDEINIDKGYVKVNPPKGIFD